MTKFHWLLLGLIIGSTMGYSRPMPFIPLRTAALVTKSKRTATTGGLLAARTSPPGPITTTRASTLNEAWKIYRINQRLHEWKDQ